MSKPTSSIRTGRLASKWGTKKEPKQETTNFKIPQGGGNKNYSGVLAVVFIVIIIVIALIVLL